MCVIYTQGHTERRFEIRCRHVQTHADALTDVRLVNSFMDRFHIPAAEKDLHVRQASAWRTGGLLRLMTRLSRSEEPRKEGKQFKHFCCLGLVA